MCLGDCVVVWLSLRWYRWSLVTFSKNDGDVYGYSGYLLGEMARFMEVRAAFKVWIVDATFQKDMAKFREMRNNVY